ncbi:hypothetical protein CAEBREN_20421 [Caenorhabditis brenneri]|uniref:Uncharacterized protein n=1 Tax=Caenorhabditis brenneri TaxID=135651 RepID=G0P5B2_CAEBE|nr:hypothetical protein CAEBREN_20421 [Caenorhabditis brenneri]
MSPDNFMRAIGLFRPVPSNASSAGLRVPTEPNGQYTSSAAGYGEALLGSPVLDEDEQKATVNRNEAAEMSNSGYTNTIPPDTRRIFEEAKKQAKER